jgi:hypothetical protein
MDMREGTALKASGRGWKCALPLTHTALFTADATNRLVRHCL